VSFPARRAALLLLDTCQGRILAAIAVLFDALAAGRRKGRWRADAGREEGA
jgi:hypothetical protein